MSGIEKVVKKLKSHPIHKSKSAAELRELAVELTSPERIREKFIHLLEAGQTLAREIVEEQNDEPLHSLESRALHEKLKEDTARACHLPVKLSLQKLSITPPGAFSFAKMLKFEYGALHSAVMIGDVVIEWGREELVEPRRVKQLHTPFLADITKHGEWEVRKKELQADMSLLDRQGNTEEMLNSLFTSLEEMMKMIEKLADVITDYNSNREYSVLKCNCQNFVRDALAALGIKRPVEFEGELQKRFEQLKEGNIKVPAAVKSHESLDAHVERYRDELSVQDMEYLQCLYFEVHSPAIEKSSDPENWECGLPTCKSAELDTLIREHSFHNSQASRRNTNSHRNSTGSSTAPNGGRSRSSFSQVSQAAAAVPSGAPPLCTQCHKFYTNVEHPDMCRGCLLEKTKRETNIHNTALHPHHGSESGPQRSDRQKCRDCNNFYADEAYNGLCHGCFLESTRTPETIPPPTTPLQTTHKDHEIPQQPPLSDCPKCQDCKHYYADEAYNGLCYCCFMFKTKRESVLKEEVPNTHRQSTQRSPTSFNTQSSRSMRARSQSYTPGYEKCQTYHCKNPRTENGYCDICNFERARQNECYLCTGKLVTDRNYVCNPHKLWVMNNYT